MTTHQEIQAIVDRWLMATQAANYAALEPLMHPEILFLTPGMGPFGLEKFKAGFAGLASMDVHGVGQVLEVEEAGDYAFAHTHLALRLTPKVGGKTIERTGHVLSVYKRNGEAWQLYRDANLLSTVVSAD